jgi:GTP-dependent phosphoenolpyruvate carboxykinase
LQASAPPRLAAASNASPHLPCCLDDAAEFLFALAQGPLREHALELGRPPCREHLEHGPGARVLDGLDLTDEQLTELFAVDPDSWLSECILTEEYFGQFGDAVPAAMYAQLEVLREHLEAAKA